MAYWDQWHKEAEAGGVPSHLADLGRQLMRDHAQHGLSDTSLGEEADGPLLLALCKAAPLQAEKRLLDDLHHGLSEDVEQVTAALMAQRLRLDDSELQVLLDAELPSYQAAWASHGR